MRDAIPISIVFACSWVLLVGSNVAKNINLLATLEFHRSVLVC